MKLSALVAAGFTSSALAELPSCADKCIVDAGLTPSQVCSQSNKLAIFQTCYGASTECSSSDRNTIDSYLKNCPAASGSKSANSASSSAASNKSSSPSGITSGSTTTTPGPFPFVNGNSGWSPSALSALSSYASAHPSGWKSGDLSSFTSHYGPLPTSGPYPFGPGNVGVGLGVGAGGWTPGKGAPFGGPSDSSSGWGPFGSSGPWTTGPWTSWWNDDKCPASNWPGWTTGSWSTTAPWTTWTACSARTTAVSKFTSQVNGTQAVFTSYGYQLAQATGAADAAASSAASSTASAGAAATAGPAGAIATGAALAFLGAVIAA